MGDMPDVSLLGILGAMGTALVFIVRQQMSTRSDMVQKMMDKPPVCALHDAMAADISEIKAEVKEQGEDIEALKISTAKIDLRTEEMQKRLQAISGNGQSH